MPQRDGDTVPWGPARPLSPGAGYQLADSNNVDQTACTIYNLTSLEPSLTESVAGCLSTKPLGGQKYILYTYTLLFFFEILSELRTL